MRKKKQSNLSRLLEYAGSYKKLTVLGCALSGVAALLSLVPFLCIWLVVRQVFEVMPAFDQVQGITGYGWMAVWFAVSSLAAYFAALMCTHLAAFRTARNMRTRAMEHLVELPLGFFTANQMGRLRKIIDDNAGMTESLLAHQLPDLVGAVVTPIAAVVLLFVFDWRMGLLCLAPMVLSVLLLLQMMGGQNANFFSRYQVALEDMSSEAVEYVRGIPVVKVFQQTVYSFKNFYDAIQRYSKLAADYAMSCRLPMTSFTTVLNGTFLLLIPAGLLLVSRASDGWAVLLDLIFYLLFAPACALMMSRIMYASEALMQAGEAVRKLDEIMAQQPLPEPEHPKVPQSSSIQFQQVCFTYPGMDRPALRQVSFSIPRDPPWPWWGPLALARAPPPA